MANAIFIACLECRGDPKAPISVLSLYCLPAQSTIGNDLYYVGVIRHKKEITVQSLLENLDPYGN